MLNPSGFPAAKTGQSAALAQLMRVASTDSNWRFSPLKSTRSADKTDNFRLLLPPGKLDQKEKGMNDPWTAFMKYVS